MTATTLNSGSLNLAVGPNYVLKLWGGSEQSATADLTLASNLRAWYIPPRKALVVYRLRILGSQPKEVGSTPIEGIMALKDGHHRTKRREGTRNCFFCRHDITKWVQLTWPQIKAIYDYCGVTPPTALCCKDCHKNKPNEELYRMFWATLMVLECKAYRDGKPTIIKDKDTYNVFFAQIKNNKHLIQKDVDEGL